MAPKYAGPLTSLYIRKIPHSLHNMFRAACCRRGLDMREVVIAYMRDYVKNDGKVHVREPRIKKKRK